MSDYQPIIPQNNSLIDNIVLFHSGIDALQAPNARPDQAAIGRIIAIAEQIEEQSIPFTTPCCPPERGWRWTCQGTSILTGLTCLTSGTVFIATHMNPVVYGITLTALFLGTITSFSYFGNGVNQGLQQETINDILKNIKAIQKVKVFFQAFQHGNNALQRLEAVPDNALNKQVWRQLIQPPLPPAHVIISASNNE